MPNPTFIIIIIISSRLMAMRSESRSPVWVRPSRPAPARSPATPTRAADWSGHSSSAHSWLRPLHHTRRSPKPSWRSRRRMRLRRRSWGSGADHSKSWPQYEWQTPAWSQWTERSLNWIGKQGDPSQGIWLTGDLTNHNTESAFVWQTNQTGQ